MRNYRYGIFSTPSRTLLHSPVYALACLLEILERIKQIVLDERKKMMVLIIFSYEAQRSNQANACLGFGSTIGIGSTCAFVFVYAC